MSFSVKHISRAQKSAPLPAHTHQLDLEPVKLQDHGERFLYHPSHPVSLFVQSAQPRNTEDYLQEHKTRSLLPKPLYESEELVFNQDTNKWELVKESQIY